MTLFQTLMKVMRDFRQNNIVNYMDRWVQPVFCFFLLSLFKLSEKRRTLGCDGILGWRQSDRRCN